MNRLFFFKKGGELKVKFSAIALTLVVIGGINWGLVGLFGFDLVAAIFGNMSVLSRIIYILVGISAVYAIRLIKK